jgi:hypothetical protein
MRHSYANKLETYVARLTSQARNKHDVGEIERNFVVDVADDIALLTKGRAERRSKESRLFEGNCDGGHCGRGRLY